MSFKPINDRMLHFYCNWEMNMFFVQSLVIMTEGSVIGLKSKCCGNFLIIDDDLNLSAKSKIKSLAKSELDVNGQFLIHEVGFKIVLESILFPGLFL